MGLAERLKAIENVAPQQPPNLQHNLTTPNYGTVPSAPPMPSFPVEQFTHQMNQNIQPLATAQANNWTQPQIPHETPKTSFLSSLTSTFTNPLKQITQTQQFNNPGPYYGAIKNRIDSVIMDKKLLYFYPNNSPQYNNLLNRVSHVDFPSIAAKRRIPMEMAFDLSALALFDVIIFVDDSGSMKFDKNWTPSSEKLDDLKLILSRFVDISTQFDDDGVSIRFFNDGHIFDNIRTEHEAMDTLNKVNFNGGTPIGKHIVTKVFQPYVYSKASANQFSKPVMVYVITDGVPDNKFELKHNILQCKHWLAQTSYGKSAVNIMFAQVGNDETASTYLKNELDNDPEIGSDIDSTGNYELEYQKYSKKGIDLTPDLWLLQMTLGSIVKEYDEGND